MENIGYSACVLFIVVALGSGLWNSVRFVKQTVTTFSTNMACGEAAANAIYCAIGTIFLIAFALTPWQQTTAWVSVSVTAAYFFYVLHCGASNPKFGKTFGIVMTGFHVLRCTALAVAITAVL